MCGKRRTWTQRGNGLEPHLALQQFQRCASSRGDVAHLFSQASLLHSCHTISTADDGDGVVKPCRPQSQSQPLSSPFENFIAFVTLQSIRQTPSLTAATLNTLELGAKCTVRALSCMLAHAPASVSATPKVPLANFSNSNTPMGPFHTMVLQSARDSWKAFKLSGPISRPYNFKAVQSRHLQARLNAYPTVGLAAASRDTAATKGTLDSL